MIINNLVTKHTKSYKTEANCVAAVEKKLGSARDDQYDLFVIFKDGGFRPVVRWRGNFQYRMLESVEAGFCTTA